MHFLGTINVRVKNFMLNSPLVPFQVSQLFGRVRGYLVYSLYKSRFSPTPAHPRRQIAKLLNPGDVYLDVGASYGITVMIATAAIGKRGVAYAFEPQDSAMGQLMRIKERFGWTNVVPVQAIVGDHVGEGVLYEYPDESRLSSISPMWKQGKGRPVTYPMITLDDWTARNNVHTANLLKIDVEGAELVVIRGAREFLRQAHPTLLMEINNRPRRLGQFHYSIDDLLTELRELGYARFYALRPTGLVSFSAEAELLDTDCDMIARTSND